MTSSRTWSESNPGDLAAQVGEHVEADREHTGSPVDALLGQQRGGPAAELRWGGRSQGLEDCFEEERSPWSEVTLVKPFAAVRGCVSATDTTGLVDGGVAAHAQLRAAPWGRCPSECRPLSSSTPIIDDVPAWSTRMSRTPIAYEILPGKPKRSPRGVMRILPREDAHWAWLAARGE
jgi:hypothetical protein